MFACETENLWPSKEQDRKCLSSWWHCLATELASPAPPVSPIFACPTHDMRCKTLKGKVIHTGCPKIGKGKHPTWYRKLKMEIWILPGIFFLLTWKTGENQERPGMSVGECFSFLSLFFFFFFSFSPFFPVPLFLHLFFPSLFLSFLFFKKVRINYVWVLTPWGRHWGEKYWERKRRGLSRIKWKGERC